VDWSWVFLAEIEMGRIRKNETTEVVVRKTEFKGSVGIDIREYVTSEKYTGWSKNGLRIPVDQWKAFKEILDKIGSDKVSLNKGESA
jgi:Transcriptional Coactivator p15 (PC4)